MNLEKAIETNQDLIAQPWLQPFPEYIASIKLGNAALENKVEARKYKTPASAVLLPGETKD